MDIRQSSIFPLYTVRTCWKRACVFYGKKECFEIILMCTYCTTVQHANPIFKSQIAVLNTYILHECTCIMWVDISMCKIMCKFQIGTLHKKWSIHFNSIPLHTSSPLFLFLVSDEHSFFLIVKVLTKHHKIPMYYGLIQLSSKHFTHLTFFLHHNFWKQVTN